MGFGEIDFCWGDIFFCGGYIFVWGDVDIDCYDIWFYECFDVGVSVYDGYFFVDIGKYCLVILYVCDCVCFVCFGF